MNQTKRLEVLEAFASSKPTEFDGFARAYLEAHPEPAVESLVSLPDIPTIEEIQAQLPTPQILVPDELTMAKIYAQEEKPKRTRKPKTIIAQTDTITVTEE
jgi:hypothetical protein